jgi:hypothetical protein
MILCSPCSLGRRRGKVKVRVRVSQVVVGVIVVVFGISVGIILVLILLVLVLRVLILGAPRKTIIRHPVIRRDVLLGGVVGRQFILAGRWAAWKLDGAV